MLDYRQVNAGAAPLISTLQAVRPPRDRSEDAVEYQLSDHAAQRAAQRNLTEDEIDFMLQFGYLLHNTGVIFCQLRLKDLPGDLPRNHRYRRLVGSTLVLCRCGGYVVTLYRESRAFHNDSCKVRYNLQKNKLANCPYCHTQVA